MANNSGTDEVMNQSEEPRTPLKRPVLKNDTGFAMVWTPEEQATLDNVLLKKPKDASKYSCVSRYARISLEFPNKTTKDIAMRCRWIKELGRVKAESSNSAPQDAVIDEVINQNGKLFYQIFDNLSYSSKLEENLTLFNKSRDNIMVLVNKLNENVPDQMKHMPPLPDKLNDDLFKFIGSKSNLP
ncbi:uncharacterized protein LOC106442814 [Brassica napus]|uniref:(rape) hypothetical protein n=1 Tax=Brassica napus TaxID=3708 RepID=A0A816WNF6_BRANA|nr:uncharacterized protein LOC106442814 [Brassica napus]CAF2132206.1 unnamed protein product [Brassica napus]